LTGQQQHEHYQSTTDSARSFEVLVTAEHALSYPCTSGALANPHIAKYAVSYVCTSGEPPVTSTGGAFFPPSETIKGAAQEPVRLAALELFDHEFNLRSCNACS